MRPVPSRREAVDQTGTVVPKGRRGRRDRQLDMRSLGGEFGQTRRSDVRSLVLRRRARGFPRSTNGGWVSMTTVAPAR